MELFASDDSSANAFEQIGWYFVALKCCFFFWTVLQGNSPLPLSPSALLLFATGVGGSARVSVLGIPSFFMLWVFTFHVWSLDSVQSSRGSSWGIRVDNTTVLLGLYSVDLTLLQNQSLVDDLVWPKVTQQRAGLKHCSLGHIIDNSDAV